MLGKDIISHIIWGSPINSARWKTSFTNLMLKKMCYSFRNTYPYLVFFANENYLINQIFTFALGTKTLRIKSDTHQLSKFSVTYTYLFPSLVLSICLLPYL